jgi:hypothetical protein
MLLMANPAATNYPQFYAAQNAWRIMKLFVPERIRSPSHRHEQNPTLIRPLGKVIKATLGFSGRDASGREVKNL